METKKIKDLIHRNKTASPVVVFSADARYDYRTIHSLRAEIHTSITNSTAIHNGLALQRPEEINTGNSPFLKGNDSFWNLSPGNTSRRWNRNVFPVKKMKLNYRQMEGGGRNATWERPDTNARSREALDVEHDQPGRQNERKSRVDIRLLTTGPTRSWKMMTGVEMDRPGKP